MKSIFMLSLGFVGVVVSAPAPTPSLAFTSSQMVQNLTSTAILSIAPASLSCDPSGTTWAGECADSHTATAHLARALGSISANTLGECAALVSTMAFESADFRANVNHFPAPGRPGQGTKSMLMFHAINSYAQSIPGLAAAYAGLAQRYNIPTVVTFDGIDAVDAEAQRAVLALVTPDEYSFAAATWFLKNGAGCPVDAQQMLKEGGYDGFVYYVTKCLQAGTTVAEDRKAKWCTAVETLKPLGMAMPVECV